MRWLRCVPRARPSRRRRWRSTPPQPTAPCEASCCRLRPATRRATRAMRTRPRRRRVSPSCCVLWAAPRAVQLTHCAARRSVTPALLTWRACCWRRSRPATRRSTPSRCAPRRRRMRRAGCSGRWALLRSQRLRRWQAVCCRLQVRRRSGRCRGSRCRAWRWRLRLAWSQQQPPQRATPHRPQAALRAAAPRRSARTRPPRWRCFCAAWPRHQRRASGMTTRTTASQLRRLKTWTMRFAAPPRGRSGLRGCARCLRCRRRARRSAQSSAPLRWLRWRVRLRNMARRCCALPPWLRCLPPRPTTRRRWQPRRCPCCCAQPRRLASATTKVWAAHALRCTRCASWLQRRRRWARQLLPSCVVLQLPRSRAACPARLRRC